MGFALAGLRQMDMIVRLFPLHVRTFCGIRFRVGSVPTITSESDSGPGSSELEACEAILGYRFRDRELLKCCLTHASAARCSADFLLAPQAAGYSLP